MPIKKLLALFKFISKKQGFFLPFLCQNISKIKYNGKITLSNFITIMNWTHVDATKFSEGYKYIY
jgi:hypothetical protein